MLKGFEDQKLQLIVHLRDPSEREVKSEDSQSFKQQSSEFSKHNRHYV
jgi:hypothetical protein